MEWNVEWNMEWYTVNSESSHICLIVPQAREGHITQQTVQVSGLADILDSDLAA